jgi:hypothetical protein
MSLPLTAFETRVAAEAQPDWCSRAEEVTYLDALVAALPARVSYESVGTSVLGNPIWQVTIAEPGGIPLDDRVTVMVTALQHGDEGGGREGILQYIRVLASDESPEITAYLQRVRWVVLTTANPDRVRIWNDGDRENANNIDLNRRHFACDQPETRAVQSAVFRLCPVIVVDAHEYRVTSGIQGMHFNVGQHTEIDSALNADGSAIVSLCRSAVAGLGFVDGIYTAVIGNRGNLTNSAGLRHAVNVLFESRRPNTDPDEVNLPRANRVLMHRTCFGVVRSYHEANEARITAQRATAIQAALAKGVSGQSYNLQNSLSTGTLRGYLVADAAYAQTQNVRTALGYRAYKSADGYVFPMRQLGRSVLPMSLDPSTNAQEGNTPVASATRLATLPSPSVRLAGSYRAASYLSGGVVTSARLVIPVAV